jgi:hypothetical protein
VASKVVVANEKLYVDYEEGFMGTSLEKSYVLVLPWTFSLSDFEKLEKVIQQEF